MKKLSAQYIRPPQYFTFNFKELWHYRELLFFFTWRDIKVKYKQTILGFIWAVLQPLLLMLIFTFFFAQTLKISTNGIPAPIFYYSGLVLWNLFSSALNFAGNSMISNAEMIKKIYFPRLIIPISATLVALFDFFMALSLFLLLLIYYQWSSSDLNINYFNLFFFIASATLLTLIGTMGISLSLAALNVQYRDFRYIIPFLIQFLFFVSPVIYPITVFEDWQYLEYILALNPMTGALEMMRACFVEKANWLVVQISSTAALLYLLIGVYVFRKMEAYFADLA
ncbi:MAG: ABC transporter permease [Bacteroidota bacterium]